VLSGSAAINGTGNACQPLVGNAAANVLSVAGPRTRFRAAPATTSFSALRQRQTDGRANNDIFVFNTALSLEQPRHLTDFNQYPGHDPARQCRFHQARGNGALNPPSSRRRGGGRCRRPHNLQPADRRADLRHERQRGGRSCSVATLADKPVLLAKRLRRGLRSVIRMLKVRLRNTADRAATCTRT